MKLCVRCGIQFTLAVTPCPDGRPGCGVLDYGEHCLQCGGDVFELDTENIAPELHEQEMRFPNGSRVRFVTSQDTGHFEGPETNFCQVV